MTHESEHKRAAVIYFLGTWHTILVICDGRRPDVVVPDGVRDPKLALRLGYHTDPPIEDLVVDDSGISAGLWFGDGVSRVKIPWEAIYLAIPDGDDRAAVWAGSVPADVKLEGDARPQEPTPLPKKSGHLKLVE